MTREYEQNQNIKQRDLQNEKKGGYYQYKIWNPELFVQDVKRYWRIVDNFDKIICNNPSIIKYSLHLLILYNYQTDNNDYNNILYQWLSNSLV